MPPLTHSKLGGSKAGQWINCPGSVALSQEVWGDFEPPASPYADEGTEAHKVAELIYQGWTPAPTTDPEMVAHARQYVAGLHTYQLLYPGTSYIEHRVAAPTIHKDVFSTVDFLHLSPETQTLVIVDFKYGQGEYVAAENNSQLLYYAMAALAPMGKEGSQFNTVILAIFQPRGENPGWRTWQTTFSRVMEYRKQVEAAIARVTGGSRETNPGDWCRWCLAKPRCRSYYNTYVKTLLETDSDKLLTPAEMGSILKSEHKVKQMLEATKDFARTICQVEGEFEGFVLTPRKGQTEWLSPLALEAAYPPERYPAMYKRGLKTPKQVLELYPELAGELTGQHRQQVYQVLKLKDT